MRTIGKIVARRATHGKSWANCLISFAFLACISIASVSYAHGIWFAPRVSQLALVYGVGSQDLEIAKRLPQVTSINAYDDAWRPVKTGLLPAGPLLLVDMENQPSAVSAVLDNGYYVKLTEDGEWLKKGRDEEPDAVSAEKTMKFAVHISKPLTSSIPLMPSHW
jgi:nickel transport protein